MSDSRKLSDAAARPIGIYFVDSGDHLTPKTGVSGSAAITLCKNLGAFAAATGGIVERGNGRYAWTPSAADLNTLGECFGVATATGADPYPFKFNVLSYDEFAVDQQRIQGMVQDNRVVEITYDGATGLVASEVIRVYDSAAHAATNDHSTGLLYTETMTNTIVGGKITVSKVVRTL